MYFGGFGMKTAPAMGKQNYSISTSLTGDSGEAFLAALTDAQRKLITDLVDLQRQDLAEIVKTRRAIATELRRFQKGESADKDKVLSLSKRYGELDGEMSYLYATAFAEVGKTLTRRAEGKAGQDAHDQPFGSQGPVPVLRPRSTCRRSRTRTSCLACDQRTPRHRSWARRPNRRLIRFTGGS